MLPFLIGQVMAIQSVKHHPDLHDPTPKITGHALTREPSPSPTQGLGAFPRAARSKPDRDQSAHGT